MDHEGRVHTLTEEALVHEIARALQVSPGPAFLAGVRSRIAEEPVGAWPIQRISLVFVVASALLVASVVTLQRVDFTSSGARTIAPLPARAFLSSMPAGVRHTVSADPPAVSAITTQEASFDVLVAPDEAAALWRLLNGAALNLSSGVEIVPDTASTPGPIEIVIPFIAIDLLESTKASEGAKP